MIDRKYHAELTQFFAASVGSADTAACMADMTLSVAEKHFERWNPEHEALLSFLHNIGRELKRKWTAPAVLLETEIALKIEDQLRDENKSIAQNYAEYQERYKRELKLALLKAA